MLRQDLFAWSPKFEVKNVQNVQWTLFTHIKSNCIHIFNGMKRGLLVRCVTVMSRYETSPFVFLTCVSPSFDLQEVIVRCFVSSKEMTSHPSHGGSSFRTEPPAADPWITPNTPTPHYYSNLPPFRLPYPCFFSSLSQSLSFSVLSLNYLKVLPIPVQKRIYR